MRTRAAAQNMIHENINNRKFINILYQIIFESRRYLNKSYVQWKLKKKQDMQHISRAINDMPRYSTNVPAENHRGLINNVTSRNKSLGISTCKVRGSVNASFDGQSRSLIPQ